MNRTQVDASMMIAGAVGLIVGSFTGWATLLDTSVSGIDGGDGWMAVAGAIVIIAFAVRLLLGDLTLPLLLAWASLFVAVGVTGINLIDIMSTGGDDVSLGWGMRLMILSSSVTLVGMIRHS